MFYNQELRRLANITPTLRHHLVETFPRLNRKAFADREAISIDYAVLECADKAAGGPVGMGWNDIGSWSAMWDLGEKDEQGNVLAGEFCVNPGAKLISAYFESNYSSIFTPFLKCPCFESGQDHVQHHTIPHDG